MRRQAHPLSLSPLLTVVFSVALLSALGGCSVLLGPPGGDGDADVDAGDGDLGDGDVGDGDGDAGDGDGDLGDGDGDLGDGDGDLGDGDGDAGDGDGDGDAGDGDGDGDPCGNGQLDEAGRDHIAKELSVNVSDVVAMEMRLSGSDQSLNARISR